MRKKRVIFAFLTMLGFPSVAFVDIPDATSRCAHPSQETTPSIEFTLVGGVETGIVRHGRTGLEWRRCVEGMNWDPVVGKCNGTAFARSWGGALQLAAEAPGEWRLPNLAELRSIVERCGGAAAINSEVFPGAPSSYHWTASPYAWSGVNKRLLYFGNGEDTWGSEYDVYTVRLVRGGQ